MIADKNYRVRMYNFAYNYQSFTFYVRNLNHLILVLMRFKFYLFTILAASALTVAAGEVAFTESNRTFYGYFNSELTYENGYGFSQLNTSHLDIPKLLYDFSEHGANPIFAGAGFDGVLYGMSYKWSGSMVPTQPSDMVAYNISSGMFTRLGPWAPAESGLKPQDMTYDATTGTMYVMGYENAKSLLLKANLENGSLEKVCDIKADQSFVTLAANPAGELYTIGIDGVLYKLNKTTGMVTKVFDTEMSGFLFNQTMEFDPTTGYLLWAVNASNFDPNEVVMVEIDLNAEGEPTMETIGQIGNHAIFTALYLPGATSYDAPATPTDLKAVYSGVKEEVTLTWTNPTKTFGNEDLAAADFNGIIVFRNGEQIAVLTDCTPGAEMTYTDSDLSGSGEYRYDVLAIGTGGDSMKATFIVYVGEDWPAAVANPEIEGLDSYTAAKITWDAVTTGFHGGEFDPSTVKYTVYRRPDNKVVAQNISETTFTDNDIRRTLNFYYEIVASNAVGESPLASTPNRILGPAFTTPFIEEFDAEAETLNRWMVTDANADYNTWMFNSTAGSQFFGDFETALEYMVSPVSGGPYEDADEWIVSGPIVFEADKSYEIELTVRSIAPETLEVAFGTSEIPDELTVTETVEIAPSEYFEGDSNIRPSFYTVALPTEGIGIGHVGLHLCTPIDPSHYDFLQICTVAIQEEGTGALGTISTPAVMTRFSKDRFEVMGEFSKVEIFNVAGVKVAESTAAVTDISSYAPGVYVAIVTTAAGRTAVKFAK